MKTIFDRGGWLFAGALAVALVMSVASVARGGSLDPTAPPGSTMRTLDEVIGAWDRRLDSTNGSAGQIGLPEGCNSDRFICAFPRQVGCAPICLTTYDAVLDVETGLVWERDPTDGTVSWSDAIDNCHFLALGGRKGWRLPTLAEMNTLVDPVALGLPAGHPFTDVVQSNYWTSTTDVDFPTNAQGIGLSGSGFGTIKTDLRGRWCVRGPVNLAGP